MTDKDTIDYCKNCSVEPPAMKFKCPECKYNPNKEQAICKYKFQDKEKFDGKPYCTCFCELCEDLPPCDDNCQIYEDYKRLTCKTSEYEELKRKVELMMDCADCKVDKYKQALDEIEKELKEDIYCENQECGCDDFEECLKCTKEHILDIINKAKGKGDD